MARKKKVLPKEMTTAAAIADITNLAETWGLTPPHLHVSDPIPDEDTLKRGLDGTYNVYARYAGHPDTSELESWLCDFEGGAKFRVFGSGMAAITAAVFAAGEINGPIHIVAVLPLYGGTYSLLRKLARSPSHHFLVTFLYANDPQFSLKLYDAIGPSTRAIIFEVAGNPTLTIPNVEEIVRIAHKCIHPIITICDNTFLFGLFKPFTWGIDVAVASDTKYLIGESSWLMGHCGVSNRMLADCPLFWGEVVEWSTELGAVPAPIETWLTSHFCTNDVLSRVIQQSRDALCIAKFLEAHPLIERVEYPGLESYPQKENAVKYLEIIDGKQYFGGMISFDLKNADFLRTEKFLYYLNNHTHIKHKASLGGLVDSVESPTLLSHAACDSYDNFRCGITRSKVRFSTGHSVSAEITIAVFDEALCAVNS